MTAPYPSARSIRHALCVLERIPLGALVDLVERLIDRLDAAGPDPDLEPETDACDAGECGGVPLRGDYLPGEADDAEPGTDDEPDDDCGISDDEPCFPNSLRPALDGLVAAGRRIVTASVRRRPAPARGMRCVPLMPPL